MTTQPTPYVKLNQVLSELVTSIDVILAGNFTGAYLQGSFAHGGYDEYSDVDFVIVVENELSMAQVEALQKMHARIFELKSHWAQHLDGSYFPKHVLRYPPNPGQELWYLDNGSSKLVKSVHCRQVDRAGAWRHLNWSAPGDVGRHCDW